MKKRNLGWITMVLVLAMTMSTLWGCGGGSDDPSSTKEAADGEEAVGEEKQVLDEGAGEDATELEYWTFVDLHGQHFSKMLGLWNKANPERQIKLNVTVMPYDDMPLESLADVVKPYDGQLVQSRRYKNLTEGTRHLL